MSKLPSNDLDQPCNNTIVHFILFYFIHIMMLFKFKEKFERSLLEKALPAIKLKKKKPSSSFLRVFYDGNKGS